MPTCAMGVSQNEPRPDADERYVSDETGGDWDGRGWGPQVAFRSDHV